MRVRQNTQCHPEFSGIAKTNLQAPTSSLEPPDSLFLGLALPTDLRDRTCSLLPHSPFPPLPRWSLGKLRRAVWSCVENNAFQLDYPSKDSFFTFDFTFIHGLLLSSLPSLASRFLK